MTAFTDTSQTFTPITTSYSSDLKYIIFEKNTYEANFYTGGKSLVHLEGAPRVKMSSETFNNNGDASSESITMFGLGIMSVAGSEMSIPNALGSQGSYSSTLLGKSLVHFKRTIQVHFSGMTFNNNWQIETDYGLRS